MRLTMKHFKKDKRVELCDEYDNVIRTKYYEGDAIGIDTVISMNAYAMGFAEGWDRARHSIGNCTERRSDDRRRFAQRKETLMPALTEEQKFVVALLWLDDQITMTAPETPRYAMYQIIRARLVKSASDGEWTAYRTANLENRNAITE